MLEYLKDDLKRVLIKTINYWDQVKGKTIFITGGTGFFGIWLQMSFIHINRKLELNAKIIVLTRDKNKFLAKYPWLKGYSEVSYLEGDIVDFKFIEGPIDYIVHAATEASVKLNTEEPLTMFDTVVNGTKRVLDFARQKNVKSFLFTSSGAVYGKQPSTIENLNEDYLGGPDLSDSGSVYGEGKRMSEVLCSVYFKHYNIPVKIARCYAFVGPFLPLNTHFAIGNFIDNVLNDSDIMIQGDGSPYRSYMYASDLVTWLWSVLLVGKVNYPYNVGSDESISIKELALIVLENGPNKNLKINIAQEKKSGPALRYVPSVYRAKEELNLGIDVELSESVRKTIDFVKKNNL